MKKSILTFIVLTILSFNAFGQNNCDISNYFDEFIQVQKSSHNGHDYLIKKVVEVEKKMCFTELINNNVIFVDYLLTNFSSNSKHQDLLKLTDSLTIKNSYFSDLKKDSIFNSLMTELGSKAIEKKIPKDTISKDDMLNVAVKYFSILRLTDNGDYVGKVCVGLNDIKKTEQVRRPFIEAFCFSSILKNYQGEDFNMYGEFVKAIKELYKINLGIDKEERLLRAQGAIFMLMRNNENLMKMLESEYKINKDYLPFILTD